MPDLNDAFFVKQKPTAERPLQGQTVLIVEDSRFASEALRLLCLKSGARVRRADSLESAARHLASYRPSVAIVDMGLPDGSGAELIREMSLADPPIAVVLAISGDAGVEREALGAGAQALLLKPLARVAEFQEAILSRLPVEMRPKGPRALSEAQVTPDALAYHDDLKEIADALEQGPGEAELAYLAQFLTSLAATSGDRGLGEAAKRLARLTGRASRTAELRQVAGDLRERLGERMAI